MKTPFNKASNARTGFFVPVIFGAKIAQGEQQMGGNYHSAFIKPLSGFYSTLHWFIEMIGKKADCEK
jgi:hypothetical protein